MEISKLIVITLGLNISRTQIPKTYLDNKSCEEIIEKIIPYLKKNDIFGAIITGINGVKEKLK